MVVKSCNFDWITFNNCLYNWCIGRMERTRMKYIEWLKEQIKFTRYKNVIRFPVEKRANQIEEEKKKKKRK
jgi:hypothetical protein